MRNIGKSKIYIVPELTANNEQWINPDFGCPELQAHYENIKRMVKEKTGRAMQGCIAHQTGHHFGRCA